MKLWVFSELHLEFRGIDNLIIPDADVCVIAGDILEGGIVPSIDWIDTNISPCMPTVFVPGNHEFYRAFLDETISAASERAKRYPGLSILNNSHAIVGESIFIGATLWTDFALLGVPEIAMRHARNAMADYDRIGWTKKPYSKLRPFHVRRLHAESVEFIKRTSNTFSHLKRVIVTHHAPSAQSIPEEYRKYLTSAAFASDLDVVILETRPHLWVHGHVHGLQGYCIGTTRVISNGRGYPDEQCFEDFDPIKVIDV